MKKVSYNILKLRQKSYIKAYAMLCLIITLSMGFYTYTKWQQYSGAVGVVEANENLITALQEDAADEKSDYEDNQDSFEDLQDQTNRQLTKILPVSDDYQTLTRQLDAFEKDLATKNNPFEVSNIAFQSIQEMDNYSVLPLRMTIKSSPSNFQKFLHYVESSGALDSDVRLMDTSSIRLSFQDGDDGEIITFSVQLNAYFRK